jgi:hypothetical protein
MRFLDTPLGALESSLREAEMKKLIELLQRELDATDAQGVPVVVANVVAGSPFTERAANG